MRSLLLLVALPVASQAPDDAVTVPRQALTEIMQERAQMLELLQEQDKLIRKLRARYECA